MVERTLCNSVAYRKAWEEVQEKAAEVGVQRAALLPIISGSASDAYLHRWTITGVPFFNANMRYSFPSYSGTVRVPIYDFGKSLANLREARALFLEADAGRGEALIQVVVEAAQAYYAALSASSEEAGARETLRLAEQTSQLATERASQGVSSISDQLRARAALANAKITYLQADQKAQETFGGVAIMIGLPPDAAVAFAPPDLKGVSEFRHVCSPTSEVRTLLTLAERRDPELRAGEAEITAQKEAIRSARATMLPSIELTVGYQSADQRFLGLDNVFGLDQIPTDNRIRSFSAQLEITVPLFDGMAGVNRLREAKAREREARASLEDDRRQLIRNVWNDYAEYRTSCCLGQEPATEYAEISRRAVLVAQARYKAGVAEITEALDAVRTLADARISEAKAVTDCAVDVVRLSTDLGMAGY